MTYRRLNKKAKAPRPGCLCSVCHWCRTGETVTRNQSLVDLNENYAAYERGELVGLDTFGALAGPATRD